MMDFYLLRFPEFGHYEKAKTWPAPQAHPYLIQETLNTSFQPIIVKTLSYPVLFASSYFMVLLLVGHLNESRDIFVSQTEGKNIFGG